jgi:hypothetical protein
MLFFVLAQTSANASSQDMISDRTRAAYQRIYAKENPDQYPHTVSKKLLLKLTHVGVGRVFSLYDDGTVICRYHSFLGLSEYRRTQLRPLEIESILSMLKGVESNTYASRENISSRYTLAYLGSESPVRIDLRGQPGTHELAPLQLQFLVEGLSKFGNQLRFKWLPRQALLEFAICREPTSSLQTSIPWPRDWPLVDTVDEDGRRIEHFTLILPAELVERKGLENEHPSDSFGFKALSIGAVTYSVKVLYLLPEEERACISIVRHKSLANYAKSLPPDWERYIYYLRCPLCANPENHPKYLDKPIQLKATFEPPEEVHHGLLFTFRRNLTNFEKISGSPQRGASEYEWTRRKPTNWKTSKFH